MQANALQITDTALMVRPMDFSFNEETAADNEFQNQSSLTNSEIRASALQEFDESAKLLRSHGINVIVIDKTEDPDLAAINMPDAVFPNNWLSTNERGQVFIYPMCTENRRFETRQYAFIEKKLLELGFLITEKVEVKGAAGQFLEGTGSMIFHKKKSTIFAAISLRTHPELLSSYSQTTQLSAIAFHSLSSNGKPFYHTNIVLCIGEGFAVVCLESIKDPEERKRVLEGLSDLEVIEISQKQTEESFCGNMLHFRNNEGKRKVVMSQRALNGLTEEQRQKLEKYGDLVALPLKNIEDIGGGSARCMLCEIFLPKK